MAKSTRTTRTGRAADPAGAGERVRRALYAAARRIPRGKVVTYGQLAALAGFPGAARAAGAAMKTSSPAMGLPWQRVVGSKGRGLAKLNILDPIGSAMQRALLEGEGVVFSAAGHIDLAAHGWLPASRKRRTARRRRRAAR